MMISSSTDIIKMPQQPKLSRGSSDDEGVRLFSTGNHRISRKIDRHDRYSG